MNARLTAALTITLGLMPVLAHADAATSAGPGRVICRSATRCDLTIGDPAQMHYKIDVTGLPDADKDRLSKQCTPHGKTPCVATVTGTETGGDAMKVKAATIKWFN